MLQRYKQLFEVKGGCGQVSRPGKHEMVYLVAWQVGIIALPPHCQRPTYHETKGQYTPVIKFTKATATPSQCRFPFSSLRRYGCKSTREAQESVLINGSRATFTGIQLCHRF
jgi:hypothetical protein